MTKFQAVVLAMIGLSISAIAFGKSIDPGAESLSKPLNLNEKQLKELDIIFTDSHAKTRQLSKEIVKVSKDRQKRIDAVLTPEQRKKYQEMQEVKLPEISPQPQIMAPEQGQQPKNK